MADAEAPDRAEKIAGYKTLLRSVIERRPSGLRGRLAMALGKHKSFVSQITNPSYSVPIPATDLPIIFEICHLAPAERDQFLALYREAHPDRLQRPPRPVNAPHELRIALPQFETEATAREVEAMILDFAARTIRLAQHAEQTAAPKEPDKRRKRS
ncbi:MAG TPA: hypothetical protein VLV76_29060 [Candidatus Acidoferrum sp.]|nr:hypothetical protein [Candidatus Acidoferrum sp.]